MEFFRLSVLISLALLAKIAVCEDCASPIPNLPVITELYHQPWDLSPRPLAKLSLQTPRPLVHHYWTVADGRWDTEYSPEPRIYPVVGSYNGIMLHTQEISQDHHQYVLYSDHHLTKVTFFFVLDIGCNIIIYEVRFDEPAKNFSSEVQPVKILKSPEREMVTDGEKWVKWGSQFILPEQLTTYYSAYDDMSHFARRNGSVLQPYLYYPSVPAYGYDNRPYVRKDSGKVWLNVDSVEMKLESGIQEFVSSVRTKYAGAYSYLGYLYHYIPFSLRTEQKTTPAIAADGCQPYSIMENMYQNYTMYNGWTNDDGSSPIVFRRRHDSPGCFRIHVNGNPFPKFEIKDLDTGNVISNWPFTITETYTKQLVATPPVPVGKSKNYEITARNSEGSLTRRIKLIGFRETVLSSSPKKAYLKNKNSVPLKCAAKGHFSTLVLYNQTIDEYFKDIYYPMKTARSDENGLAELTYLFTNMTGVGEDTMRGVYCSLDQQTMTRNASSEVVRKYRRNEIDMVYYSEGPHYKYN